MRFAIKALTVPALLVSFLATNQLVVGQESGDQRQGRRQTERAYQEREMQRREQRGRTTREQQQQRQRQQQQQVTGTVLRTKQVDVRGTDRKELVVLLRTREGRRLIADLGTTRNLRDVEIRTGDQITVRGPIVRCGEHRVLMATRIQANDQWVTAQHAHREAGQRAAARRGYPVQREMRQLTGQIVGTKRVNLRDSDRQHLVALVRTQRGQRAVVDLGRPQQLQDLDLQQGDRVSIRGHVMFVNERPILLATRISTNGGTAQIDRSGILRQGEGRQYGERQRAEQRQRAGRSQEQQRQRSDRQNQE